MKQAMIFAAGLGTRLKPITDYTPKALVKVGGEPLLKRVIFRLKESGFDRIIINIHHFSNQILDYLKANDNFGLDIRISDESDMLLETGGGIKKARQLFSPLVPILIHNVDILSNVDLSEFYQQNPRITCPDCGVPHVMASATLLVSQRKTKRYLVFDRQMRLVGWTNIETGEVKSPFPAVLAAASSFKGKQGGEVEEFHLYAFSGIHTFSPQLFPLMESYPDKFPIMDFYLQNCDKVFIKGFVKNDLKLMDVGKQETLAEAENFLEGLEG